MVHPEKQKELQLVFLSHEQNTDTAFLINLLKRHPEICVFDGTDLLIDNLLKFPQAAFGVHNTVFFELIFELFNDSRFGFSENPSLEFEEISKSKNCYDAFTILMRIYCKKNKPSAHTIVYCFKDWISNKEFFSNYFLNDSCTKYIHQFNSRNFKNQTSAKNTSETILSSICNGILQVTQKDFETNYDYEYKRLFRFINSIEKLHSDNKYKGKKLYKKSVKLAEVQNSWFRQIVNENEKVHEKVYAPSFFRY